ncbi:MAG: hypothetical protein IH840_18415 [Candidatus Heimdallarchaeota archaeon]|nr:hypothetical protein [Candidatus Heimdallarchaeota archaeon]
MVDVTQLRLGIKLFAIFSLMISLFTPLVVVSFEIIEGSDVIGEGKYYEIYSYKERSVETMTNKSTISVSQIQTDNEISNVLLFRFVAALIGVSVSLFWNYRRKSGSLGSISSIIGGAFFALLVFTARNQLRELASDTDYENGNYILISTNTMDLHLDLHFTFAYFLMFVAVWGMFSLPLLRFFFAGSDEAIDRGESRVRRYVDKSKRIR